jgi:hypothetical protein
MLKTSDNSLTVQAPTKGSTAIVNAIRQASTKTGVDFAYLLENATTESGLNANAKASGSSAQGLYQFIESTWLETVDKHGAEHGLDKAAAAITHDSNGNLRVADPKLRREILAMRNDPQVASLMAAELTQDNKATLEQSLGREVNNTELYLAHFLGASGASRMLSKLHNNPQSTAAQVLPAAANSNHNVFYQGNKAVSVTQLYDHFAEKFANAPATNAIATADNSGAATEKTATIAAIPASERLAVAANTGSPASTTYHEQAIPASLPLHNLPQLAFNILQSLVLPGDAPEKAEAADKSSKNLSLS